MNVYGSKASYFTGKLESYLRYKGIAYHRYPLIAHQKRIRAAIGTTQMPAVENDDGRFMTDSTPIILYLENQHPQSSILPTDPLLRFLAFLIEDYADEWLWRAAMHYRWTYRQSRELLSSILIDELLLHIPLPRFWKRQLIARRQRRGFVIGDGVSKDTQSHVEQGYRRALANMSQMLERRPYLLGDQPSIADFGLMGPMLRHFSQDPTPAEIMRDEAPAVYAWVARLWNARHDPKSAATSTNWLDAVPEDAMPMLREVCETHLRQLEQNARAFTKGTKRFDQMIQGCQYRRIPVSRYRVWCLEQLRERFEGLRDEDQDRLHELLCFEGASVLWDDAFAQASGYDEKREVPFGRGINVYAKGVPE
jgi:glutathione S-transferase